MDQQQPRSAVPDLRGTELGHRSSATDSVVNRIIPKRTAPPPQVAAFDSAM